MTVVCTPSLLPTTTCLQLSAIYQACDGNFPTLCVLCVCVAAVVGVGTQQGVEHEVTLPLHLFCEPVYPEKAAEFKVNGPACCPQ